LERERVSRQAKWTYFSGPNERRAKIESGQIIQKEEKKKKKKKKKIST